MSKKQTHEFQTEVSQLLNLMIHSLYSNKEIFLRELVSNASDAIDKLKFESLSNDKLLEGKQEPSIQIDVDKDAGTITIKDNGIGMTQDEVMENIGTIANSGTRKYLESLDKNQTQDSNLIGQFGVGFYSAFMVADKVEVLSRKAGNKQVSSWESDGQSGFSIDKSDENQAVGTKIKLFLKKDAKEFAAPDKIKTLIKKYA